VQTVSANAEIYLACALSSFPIAVPAIKHEYAYIVQICVWRLFGVYIYLKAMKGFSTCPKRAEYCSSAVDSAHHYMLSTRTELLNLA